MLPPLASATLERNPRFRELYKDLTTARLNPDATTRLLKQQRAQAEVEKSLQTIGEQVAQIDVVVDALKSLDVRGDGMNPETLEEALLLAAHIEGQLSEDEIDILSEDFQAAASHAPVLATVISQHLQKTQLQLSTVLGSENPFANQVNLAKNAMTLKTAVSNQRSAILNAKTTVTELAEQLQLLYRECLETSIRILEQVLHGSVARGTKARAEHLATVAKGLDLKIQTLDKTDHVATDANILAALRSYGNRLDHVQSGLEARENAAASSLEQYRRGGSGMDEIAAKYAELVQGCDDVRDEIRRLQGGR